MPKERKFISFIYSLIFHGLIIVFILSDIWHTNPPTDFSMNVEIAGAAEMQRALDNYNQNESKIVEQVEPKDIKNVLEKQLSKNPKKEQVIQKIEQVEPKEDIKNIIGDQLPENPEKEEVAQNNVISEIPPLNEELINDTDLFPKQEDIQPESQEDISPVESSQTIIEPDPNEEALRLKEEEEQKQKKEKERLEKEKKIQEEMKRAEEQAKKEKEEKLKKQQELRRKKEMEAIKRIEKKKKERKKRLAKLAKEAKKIDDKKKRSAAFDKMLAREKSNIIKNSKRNVTKISKISGFGNGLGNYGNGKGFTDSDAAIISSQVIPHWVVPGGVRNAESLIIRIRIKLKDNGEVIPSSIEILDMDRYNSDYVFRSAADSAKRAILEASPFKIPAEKMYLFRDFEFSFNTDKALGG